MPSDRELQSRWKTKADQEAGEAICFHQAVLKRQFARFTFSSVSYLVANQSPISGGVHGMKIAKELMKMGELKPWNKKAPDAMPGPPDVYCQYVGRWSCDP